MNMLHSNPCRFSTQKCRQRKTREINTPQSRKKEQGDVAIHTLHNWQDSNLERRFEPPTPAQIRKPNPSQNMRYKQCLERETTLEGHVSPPPVHHFCRIPKVHIKQLRCKKLLILWTSASLSIRIHFSRSDHRSTSFVLTFRTVFESSEIDINLKRYRCLSFEHFRGPGPFYMNVVKMSRTFGTLEFWRSWPRLKPLFLRFSTMPQSSNTGHERSI